MSWMDFDQSMSEDEVKSCMGTFFHVSCLLCCVIFNVPNNALANFPDIYFNKASASSLSAKKPIVINVCVVAISGSPTNGLTSVSPKVPLLLDSGRIILYPSNPRQGFKYLCLIYINVLFPFCLPQTLQYISASGFSE